MSQNNSFSSNSTSYYIQISSFRITQLLPFNNSCKYASKILISHNPCTNTIKPANKSLKEVVSKIVSISVDHNITKIKDRRKHMNNMSIIKDKDKIRGIDRKNRRIDRKSTRNR